MPRIEPGAPPAAFKTYSITSPRDETVKAACEQVGCAAWRHGWETAVDESAPLGQFQASYIRTQSGRTFRELKRADGVTVFRFEAGQRCFADHKTRPEFYLVRGGDWRANLGVLRRHSRPIDWVEDFCEHQEKVADQ
jgi:hypothetical protein